MLQGLEKFVKRMDVTQYIVKYIDIKDSKIFTSSIKTQLTKYMLALNTIHKNLLGKDFSLLGLEDEMSDKVDWEWYKRHAHVYALYDQEKIIGICTCKTHKSGGLLKNVCYIMELIVDENYRGQGLGTHLLNETVSDCKKHEPYISVAMLDVMDANTTSMRSYLNQGFQAFRHSLYKQI